MEKKSLKKLSLKKVTILSFDEANKLAGGGLLGFDTYPSDPTGPVTDVVNCPSGDTCFRCFTEGTTCPASCAQCV